MTTIDSGADLKKMAAQSRVNSLTVLTTPIAVVVALAVWLGQPGWCPCSWVPPAG